MILPSHWFEVVRLEILETAPLAQKFIEEEEVVEEDSMQTLVAGNNDERLSLSYELTHLELESFIQDHLEV